MFSSVSEHRNPSCAAPGDEGGWLQAKTADTLPFLAYSANIEQSRCFGGVPVEPRVNGVGFGRGSAGPRPAGRSPHGCPQPSGKGSGEEPHRAVHMAAPHSRSGRSLRTLLLAAPEAAEGLLWARLWVQRALPAGRKWRAARPWRLRGDGSPLALGEGGRQRGSLCVSGHGVDCGRQCMRGRTCIAGRC